MLSSLYFSTNLQVSICTYLPARGTCTKSSMNLKAENRNWLVGEKVGGQISFLLSQVYLCTCFFRSKIQKVMPPFFSEMTHMRLCIYATFSIMVFLFSGRYSTPCDPPGESFAWNHSKQQLILYCWSISPPSFILPGQWKRNHFRSRTGAPLCFSWSWIYIRSWSSMSLW